MTRLSVASESRLPFHGRVVHREDHSRVVSENFSQEICRAQLWQTAILGSRQQHKVNRVRVDQVFPEIVRHSRIKKPTLFSHLFIQTDRIHIAAKYTRPSMPRDLTGSCKIRQNHIRWP